MKRPTFALALTFAAAFALPPPAAADPALTVPADELAAALSCPIAFTNTANDPVLLVHGTAGTAEDHWSWNYAKALPAMGYDVCLVHLPELALGDIQIASEYVVFAIAAIAHASGRKVDVIGISQGGLEPRWALRWWPSLHAKVDDYVSLASPHHGTLSADTLCPGPCAAAVQQMKTGSALIAALNSCDETPGGGSDEPGGVSYTSVFSLTDELVQPAVPVPTSALYGASNVLVQDVCPGRPVHHAAEVYDAVVHAVVMDALTHPGPADPARLSPSACAGTVMPGATEVDAVAGNQLVYGNGYVAFATARNVDEEPPLAAYATNPSCGP